MTGRIGKTAPSATEPLRIAGSTVVSALAALAVALIAAERFATSSYAQFVMFMGTSILVSSLCDLGVSNRFVTTFRGADEASDRADLSRAWAGQFWSYATGFALVAGTAILTPAATFLNVPSSTLFWGATHGVFIGTSSFLLAVLQARQSWRERSWSVIVQAACRTSGAVPGLATDDVDLLLVGSTCGALVGFLIPLLINPLGDLRAAVARIPSPTDAFRAWKHSRWFAVAIVAGAATTYFPIAAVGHDGREELAIFGFALQLANGPNLLLSALMTFALPQAVDRTLSIKSYRRIALHLAFRVVTLIVIGGVVAPLVLQQLFNGKFEHSVLPLEILLVSTALVALANPFQFLYYRTGEERFLAGLDILMLAITVCVYLGMRQLASPSVSGATAVLAGMCLPKAIGIGRLLIRGDMTSDARSASEEWDG